ncbi:MAG: hypothetical protein KGM97_01330 [Alphaproteobacteria bacterium]|nr:hypothetical protein [Alphaproteobacteria bacterium]MDE2629606.1 hypothetical protein [Alphaproteobacteria bacterium]
MLLCSRSNTRTLIERTRSREVPNLRDSRFSVAGFAPAAFSHLTGWLDVATDFGERLVGG